MSSTGIDRHAGPTARSTALAAGLFGVVLAEVATAVLASLVAGFDYEDARDSFALTNSVIALSFAAAGVLIAWQRPRNPLGWLLLGAAVFQGSTAASAPLVGVAVVNGWPDPVTRTIGTVAAYGWPWSIALFVPLALLAFPTGSLPGRWWRPLAWFAGLDAVGFALSEGADPNGAVTGPAALPWLVLDGYDRLGPLWAAVDWGNGVVYLGAMAGLVVRYRRGDERLRRQLLWLVLALGVMLVMLAVWVPATDSRGQLVLILLAIPLVPAAMTIAVLRHGLLDIRLVFSRAVLYAVLSAGVVGAYLGLVAVADLLLRSGPGPSLIATVLVAVAFNPVRVRLQRVVDRALYGDRADPVRALARMGERLASGTGHDPSDVLAAVQEALRLPYAALRSGDAERAAVGTPPELLETVPLTYRGMRVGELVVGARSGQRALDPADRAALTLLAAPLAVAVHATALSEAVQRSREQIVAAREEERRRLRRDLHDGLGPALTGIAFRADAAGNLLHPDPERAAQLLAELRSAATEAIDDVRRLVHALRPPALDELGLAGALRRQGEQLGVGGPTITVNVEEPLPELSAAVEVAAYRIAVEAMTNAVRHARAGQVDLRLTTGDALEIAVRDDGAGRSPRWAAGVGLSSIGERAAELGGQWRAGPVASGGGLVWARLPLGGPDG